MLFEYDEVAPVAESGPYAGAPAGGERCPNKMRLVAGQLAPSLHQPEHDAFVKPCTTKVGLV